MGRLLVREVLTTPGFSLAGGSLAEGDDMSGMDIGIAIGIPALGINASPDAEELFSVSQLVIDFTTPEATRRNVWLAAKHRTPLVIGTTGLTREDEAEIADAGKEAPVLYAPNMSLGVNIMSALVEKVAAMLGPDAWDIEISETHHRQKIDAPSGTALALGRAAAKGRGQKLDDVAIYARKGHTGERPEGGIGFSVRRGGDVAGEHTVSFFGEGERYEISHSATSRLVFARGAIRAAQWLKDQPPGLYSMRDVLGL
jgi:4-hydroxy-tetrahydrodipicolinate reductase